MNDLLSLRCINITLSEILSDEYLSLMKWEIEKILQINLIQHILKYEDDTEWFILLNGIEKNFRLWLTIFQDSYEPVNRIIINELSVSFEKEIDKKELEKQIIKTVSEFLRDIGVISVYSNNTSLPWEELGFMLEENKLYFSLK
ncbi:hypothetical protein SAMN04244560_02255 [Thermoanaerobacter thermohydrosulfuricus]|uniref:Uncharacterized protein n=3 Tax=Thermoanaerobacter TaxID=1754 RepID=G2MTR0_9THEO|nr:MULTISPECIES: hypothetical protein [Thermoanaerobacter]EGD51831.1 hypothetical protein TheetDRAFT_1364 [Thermoanaerobacter ethanolicus JW 200]HHY80280.1 hypothetical protein [Thermoanaerobacter sp.]AEM79074.1 hypothetical protein Thewi_1674 [Thermoanaerobacter wiegelii Rt8.B1]EMT38509.1 hypothetical protein TthWC1_1969 [Thermoanaerobacter thermohydrosulfuricus WC1]UZQ82140.1 hypothetical protein OEI98_001938 [Thermoanaerobacter sp. RKWS2]